MPYFTNSDEDQDDTFEIIEEVTKKTKYDFDLESGFYEVKSKSVITVSKQQLNILSSFRGEGHYS